AQSDCQKETIRLRSQLKTLESHCAQIYNDGNRKSGFYMIKPLQAPSKVKVYCDMSEGGGWTVIQRRSDGSESFDRINLVDFEDNYRYAVYTGFKVASEKDSYQLGFGRYSGSAGDSLSGSYHPEVQWWASHQGMKFSTHDRDNDRYERNCAHVTLPI
ncbi:hypothetical protein JZ751_005921, partial [Albula glossodonta]